MIKFTADKVKVWKNVKEDGTYNFTYSISNKKQDGSYEYMSKRIRFMKDKEPEDSCEIMVEDAFQGFFTMNDKQYDYIMVMKYETLSGKDTVKDNEELAINDDDLPF